MREVLEERRLRGFLQDLLEAEADARVGRVVALCVVRDRRVLFLHVLRVARVARPSEASRAARAEARAPRAAAQGAMRVDVFSRAQLAYSFRRFLPFLLTPLSEEVSRFFFPWGRLTRCPECF